MNERYETPAYGGPGWSPREDSHREEIGRIWSACGVAAEWHPLRTVLLHRPGAEIEGLADPLAVQMLAQPDPARARAQHDRLAETFRAAGVTVRLVEPAGAVPPNLMFVADLLFMTPEGAILGRPASSVRAGEERLVAWRLAELGVPVLRAIRGGGTFEGADAMWLDPDTVLLATGRRTNAAGAAQVAAMLAELGVAVIRTPLPFRSMHLMGLLRIVDGDLAVGWPGAVPPAAAAALRARNIDLLEPPPGPELDDGRALNFVTLGPRRILMPDGNPATRVFLERAGIECLTTEVNELAKAAGAIGCLTGILERQQPELPRGGPESWPAAGNRAGR
ncbi:MAG TPA: arginine deiminase family protein [Acidobacteriota bacterium]|nr:amidinotransferase [Acidobacteriota bacterium]HQF85992.1 arginine deiminase family protein [Acidobacteriota bacterium]HQG90765.1 arginine deiminase family protein [Acidobacteriota bacterium]